MQRLSDQTWAVKQLRGLSSHLVQEVIWCQRCGHRHSPMYSPWKSGHKACPNRPQKDIQILWAMECPWHHTCCLRAPSWPWPIPYNKLTGKWKSWTWYKEDSDSALLGCWVSLLPSLIFVMSMGWSHVEHRTEALSGVRRWSRLSWETSLGNKGKRKKKNTYTHTKKTKQKPMRKRYY